MKVELKYGENRILLPFCHPLRIRDKNSFMMRLLVTFLYAYNLALIDLIRNKTLGLLKNY